MTDEKILKNIEVNITDALVKNMLDDFEADNEEELYETLIQDSNTIPCIICGKEMSFGEIYFIDGDPYCKKHKNVEDKD